MQRKITLPCLKFPGILFNSLLVLFLALVLISMSVGCSSQPPPAQTTSIPESIITNQTSDSNVSVTPTPAPSAAVAPKPEGELIAAQQTFGNENWLPWADPSMANLHDIVYDMLIYWDHINHEFLPGLAESWNVSSDGLNLIYHVRKGIQFSDGWGEFTSEDVKYNFEMHASKTSIGKAAQCRRIASMDTPDAYTLEVHFKDPYPTFFVDLSMGNSGVCQGIVCKKYLETVGVDEASQKPIGTGPYKLIESKSGDYMKFEAIDDNWRLVPEFKYLTARLIPETSTVVAALKTKEIDLSQVPAAQLADLKSAGVAVEASTLGGNIIMSCLGGMVISADKRYNVELNNKDPWVDSKVRKAMALAIDRDALVKAIYAGYAEPVGVPIYTPDMGKYQYPYDPEAAKKLLVDAGYPNGFSFRVISYAMQGLPEMPQIAESLAGFWQQIGLDPKITVIDYNTYNNKNTLTCKTAGDTYLLGLTVVADQLSRIEMSMMPNGISIGFEDEGSYAIYKDNPSMTFEERNALVEKINQYYFENVGPIPLVRIGYCYGWNSDKVAPWAHSESPKPIYLEYVRHAQPLNTFRLFSPVPGR